MAQPTILSASTNEMKTMIQYPGDNVQLTVWTDRGNTTISLSRSETLAFLRALPPSLLVEVFGEDREDTEPAPSDASATCEVRAGQRPPGAAVPAEGFGVYGGGGGAPRPKGMEGTVWHRWPPPGKS